MTAGKDGGAGVALKVGDRVRVLPIVAALYHANPQPRPGIVRDMVDMVGKEYTVQEQPDFTCGWVNVNEWDFLAEWLEKIPEGEALPTPKAEGSPSPSPEELIRELVGALERIAQNSLPCRRLGAALENVRGIALEALAKAGRV
jgi:hypothetical protein